MLSGFLERTFRVSQSGSNIRTEIIAGTTTFLTMAYIIFVNPDIMALTGMDREALVVATCLAAAGPTIAMGWWANIPVCQAPGMGLNAFFTFTLVGVGTAGLVDGWQQALGVVFISGSIFVLLTFLNIRELIVEAIPAPLKMATAVGIGLFIAFIGFSKIGLVVSHPVTFVTLTHHWTPQIVLSLLGIVLMGILMIYRVRGAILIGIFSVTVLGTVWRAADYVLYFQDLGGRPWFAGASGGPLAELGLQKHDILLSIDGKSVDSVEDLASWAPAPASDPARPIAVEVARSLWRRNQLTLQAQPAQLGAMQEAAKSGGAWAPLSMTLFSELPTRFFSMPTNLDKIAFKLSFHGLFNTTILVVIFAFMFVDLFDSVGTLIAVGVKARLTDDKGNLPQIRQALQVDAFATLWGAALGTSTVVSYIESAAGAEAGGRTGLTAVWCGILFLAALFLGPLIAAIPSYAISPTLIIVGLAMLDHISAIDFTDIEEAMPAFLTIILMPLTYNISTGLGFGFLAYVLLKLMLGKRREIHWMLYFICGLFLMNLAFGGA